MMKSILAAFFFFPAFFSGSIGNNNEEAKIHTRTVYATYYASKFEGRRTSSGAKYRAKKFTAAHLTLPFGTEVSVTNVANGRNVTVVVNDRGPHSKKYSIDLSAAAAKELGFYSKGVAKVEIAYSIK